MSSKIRRQPNSHADFSRECFGYARTSPGNHPKKIVRMYIAWVFSKLAAGEEVAMPGVGTIKGKFRKGRITGASMTQQPDTFVLRIRASVNLRKKLNELAIKNPSAF